ncbi:MAG: class I SAM-dependent methyltransferase [Halioglobus sp.]
MGFYDNSENVDQYIEMCGGYDGSNLYEVLHKNLTDGSSVLELGSGPGFDIPFLREHYDVTGSDFSDEFLKRCRKTYPDISFLKIDASKIDVKEKFDCIYSNKVLHHITECELAISLTHQAGKLTENGIIAHSFWIGKENQEMKGMLFTYYLPEDLIAIISENFQVLTTLSYQEFEDSDSLFVIAKLRKSA